MVHLTGTQDVAADVFGSNQLLRVGLGDVALEVGVADHLRKFGTCLGMTEEGFREEDDERLAVVTVNLATKDMEVVGRSPETDTCQ